MSPFGLAKDIFGLAEVVCVYTKYDPFIKIVDRNQQMINIPFVSTNQTTQHISETIVSMLSEQHQPQTYDILLGHRLHEEHQGHQQLQEEMILETEQIINIAEASYEDFKQYYTSLIEEYNQLLLLKADLEKQIKRHQKDYVLVGSKENYKQEEALIIDVFKKELRRLDNKDVYRRRDIINALMEVLNDES